MTVVCRLPAILLACLLCLLAQLSFAQIATNVPAPARLMQLATLEWAPNVGSHLPDEGITSAVVKAAAALAGMDVDIHYSPWSRAMQVGLGDPAYAGYFPAFYLPERDKTCYFSGALGHTVVGFASLQEKNFHWKSFADLHGLTVGVVQDYANGEEFDALIKKHTIKTDTAPSDVSNLRKLLAGRVDVLVISKEVLRYLLITEPTLQAGREHIVFDAHELSNFSMHICFQRNERGLQMQKAFNTALEKINPRKLENAYFQHLLQLQAGRR
ncbi:MAG: transporter substrate-binding domain-containing protein [Burkholderiales bacterium]|nr:transporter substrate-binding domain-containing protein [Burkholderiales bacterium]